MKRWRELKRQLRLWVWPTVTAAAVTYSNTTSAYWVGVTVFANGSARRGDEIEEIED